MELLACHWFEKLFLNWLVHPIQGTRNSQCNKLSECMTYTSDLINWLKWIILEQFGDIFKFNFSKKYFRRNFGSTRFFVHYSNHVSNWEICHLQLYADLWTINQNAAVFFGSTLLKNTYVNMWRIFTLSPELQSFIQILPWLQLLWQCEPRN